MITALGYAIVLVIAGTSIWAADDAQERQIIGESNKDIGGPPLLILFACLFIWPIALPYYLIKRALSKRP